MSEIDVLVIGSGAGGAPVAARLAQAGRKVVLIEAGGPVENGRPFDVLQRHYLHGGMISTMGEARIAVMAGRALGGTTVVNAGTSLPPPAQTLAEWDRTLGFALSDQLREPLARATADMGVVPQAPELLGASNHLFTKGAAALGHQTEPLPRNAPACQGAGRCSFGCPHGAKRSTDRTYVLSARSYGAEVWCNTTATRVSADRRVWLRDADGGRVVRARQIVLAGGALGTPALIRRSRLGRWRAAGNGLTLHPCAKVVAMFPHAVHGDRGVPQGVGLRLLELPRILFEGSFLPRELMEAALMCSGRELRRWLDAYSRLAAFGLMVKDTGRGSVRDLFGVPLIRYGLDREDARQLIEGLRFIGLAFLRAGAERVLMPWVGATNSFADETALRAFPAASLRLDQLDLAGMHPLGTAAIGRVVDHDQALVPGVWVADGSLLPGPPGVNPQMSILAMAHRLAGLLVAQ